MRARCRDISDQNFPQYGGRGVTVCDRWYDSFEVFRDDVGERPSPKHSLDRIDTLRGYEPGNVRWATRKEQCNNKRTNRVIELDGVSRTVMQWAEALGLSSRLICQRLDRGASPADALKPRSKTPGVGPTAGAMSRDQRCHYAMIRRCTNPKCADYPDYGGRGISVCERWLGKEGLANFLKDMGPHPGTGYSLDRVDSNGPYSPDNCRWATAKAQARNTRRTRLLTHNGETMCVSAWAERYGIPPYKITQRLKRGWTAERAITTP